MRDDMRDFYKRYDTWLLDRLRRDLPGYVYYRNHIRGHHALGGKPAITRLNEHTHLALPAVLERLESYACYEMGRKTIPATGSIRLFGRAYLGTMAGREVTFFESLEGLEAQFNGECAVLKDYRTFKQMVMHYRQRQLPPAFTSSLIRRSSVRELLAHPDTDPTQKMINGRKAGNTVRELRPKTPHQSRG